MNALGKVQVTLDAPVSFNIAAGKLVKESKIKGLLSAKRQNFPVISRNQQPKLELIIEDVKL